MSRGILLIPSPGADYLHPRTAHCRPAPFIADHPVVSAQEEPALLVDDAETANPELVEVEVAIPLGFGVSGQTLQVPPGYTVAVVAAGLGSPPLHGLRRRREPYRRTGTQGTVFASRSFAEGQLGEPETLISGLQPPASVAFFTTDEGEYLYVGEINQVSRVPLRP